MRGFAKPKLGHAMSRELIEAIPCDPDAMARMSALTRRDALSALGAAGALGLELSATNALAQDAPIDPLTIQGTVEQQWAGPLSMITIRSTTTNMPRRFLQGGMGMSRGPLINIDKTLYGLDGADPPIRTYVGPDEMTSSIGVRIIGGADPASQPLRPNHNALIPGILSIGFPVSGIEARAKILAAYDYPAVSGVTDITMPRGDGSTYKVSESHHRGPDGVLCLCIDRGALKPVGPIDTPSLSIGGPAYAGMIVTDAGEMEEILRGIMGWQKRRDVELSSSGPNGGLGLPVGQRFKFQQYFAPGTDTGYLVVMQHLTNQVPAPEKLGLKRRGIGMLSFKTKALTLMARQARVYGIPGFVFTNDGNGNLARGVLTTQDGIMLEFIQV